MPLHTPSSSDIRLPGGIVVPRAWLPGVALMILTTLIVGVRLVQNLGYLDQSLSPITTTTPFWDFNNLWSGARMALDGNVGTLWDADAYRAALRAMHDASLPDHEWSYPPHILLVGMPLAMLPEWAAYVLWTVATLALVTRAMLSAGLKRSESLLLLASPLVLFNALLGQNGALTAGLFIGGFALMERRPVLAGILFGLLTIKPHWGLVIVAVLLVTRSWLTIASAIATALAMVTATTFLLGVGVWEGFLNGTVPLMKNSIMFAEVPQFFQQNSATWFIIFRELGLNVPISQMLQGIITLICIALTAFAWWRHADAPRIELIAVTAALACLALPYGYTYELIGLGFAGLVMLRKPTTVRFCLFALLWSLPVVNLYIFQLTFFSMAPVVVLAITVTLWRDLLATQASESDLRLARDTGLSPTPPAPTGA